MGRKDYGLKQGAIAGTLVSTRNTRMAAPVVARRYTHNVTVCGQAFPCTEKEYTLLRTLQLRRGAMPYAWRSADGRLEYQ
jgi:hypothetical protein